MIYKNPTVSYALAENEDPQYTNVDAAEIVINKPYVCKALTQINSKDAKTRSASEETIKTSKVYTFDITKADAIFDQLLLAKIIKLRPGHNIPKAEELKGKTYCKFHNSNKYTTNNCVVFHDAIQSWIDKGKLKFPEKQMAIDVNPFPSTTIGMVDAHLPKNKGKGKAEFVPVQYIHKQNSQPRLKIDLFSNEPPMEFSGSAIVESILGYSFEETVEPMVLCDHCKTWVVLTKPEERIPQAPTSYQPSTAAVKPLKELGAGQHQ